MLAVDCVRLRENRLIIARLNAGRSSGWRLVTQLPSSTTSRSTQLPPALRTSSWMVWYYPGNKEGHIPTRSASEGPMKSSESRRGSPLDD